MKNLAQKAQEIRRLDREVWRQDKDAARKALRIGAILLQAKAKLAHGSYGKFWARAGLSKATANRYSRFAEAAKKRPSLKKLALTEVYAELAKLKETKTKKKDRPTVREQLEGLQPGAPARSNEARVTLGRSMRQAPKGPVLRVEQVFAHPQAVVSALNGDRFARNLKRALKSAKDQMVVLIQFSKSEQDQGGKGK